MRYLSRKIMKATREELKIGNLALWNNTANLVNVMTMLELTEGIDEHPEDYEGACYCDLCLSYGD